jgi:tetratricopeptide (TPR) repeat protein
MDHPLFSHLMNTAALDVQLDSLPDPMKRTLCSEIAIKLIDRYEKTKCIDDITRAITLSRYAECATPDDDEDLPVILSILAKAFECRCKGLGQTNDLVEAIQIMEKALRLAPEGHRDNAMCLNNLGQAYLALFETSVSEEHLTNGIELTEKAGDATSPDDPVYSIYRLNLASALKARFRRNRMLRDLDRAIEIYEEFNPLARTDRLEPPARVVPNPTTGFDEDRVDALGLALMTRAKENKSSDDLNRAIALYREITGQSWTNSPKYLIRLHRLGFALQMRAENVRAVEDLREAIGVKKEALDNCVIDDPNRLVYLSNLSNGLQTLFEWTGDVEHLDEAISKMEALSMNTLANHDEQSVFLNNLGTALQSRFERLGATDDLDRAISVHREAIRKSPQAAQAHPHRIVNLATALEKRYSRTGSTTDIVEAMILMENALSNTETEDSFRAFYFNALAVVLLSRFQQSQLDDDLNRAILNLENAVNCVNDSDANVGMYFSNLGNAFQNRFVLDRDPNDLELAVEMKQKALPHVHEEHPDRAIYLNNLANSLLLRYRESSSVEDLFSAISCYEQGASLATASASARLRMADAASRLLTKESTDWSRAKRILEMAVDLLPTLGTGVLQEKDQQYNLSKYGTAGIVAARAVSVSLECGESATQALRLLEQSRGILSDTRMSMRSDISAFESAHPALAKRFQDVRERLDRSESGKKYDVDSMTYLLSDTAPIDRATWKEFQNVVGEIRNQKGFATFAGKGLSAEEIKELACDGPVVAFNVSDIRSDAFIVTPHDIRSIKLSMLTESDLEAYYRRFSSSLQILVKGDYIKARREINVVLKWLWEVAVQPILENLGIIEPPPNERNYPRIWWVGCYLLNLLPLHAAGTQDGTRENALDRVISSFIPSIRALNYARERQRRAREVPHQRILLLAMPKTIENPDLTFAEQELRQVQDLNPKASMVLKLYPSREFVTKNLKDCQIVHFSCHGYSEPHLAPAMSKLLLVDWKESPLTISDIMSVHMECSEFAFLSACHTAHTHEISLTQEVSTLVSAMHLAGFPSVVGTLWQVRERQAIDIVRDVYEWMLVGDKFETQRAAEGLHSAVLKLRRKTREGQTHFVEDPIVWAPYIHVGV